MASDETAAQRRREARASTPIRVFRLGEEPGDDLSDCTTPEERIAMMWPLAVDAWTSAGRRLPGYSRDRMPGRVVPHAAGGRAEPQSARLRPTTLNPDFLDLLAARVRAEARFLIFGAHAVAAHGVPRASGDLDVWIRPAP